MKYLVKYLIASSVLSMLTFSPTHAQTLQAVHWPGNSYGFKARLPGTTPNSPQGIISKCFALTSISVNTEQALVVSYANAANNPIVLDLSLEYTVNVPNTSNGVHLKFSTTDGPGGTGQTMTAFSETPLIPTDGRWHCFSITWDTSNWSPFKGINGEYAIAGHLDGTPFVWNSTYTGGGLNPQPFSTPYHYGGVWNNWSVMAELDSTGQPHNFYTNYSAEFYIDVEAVDYGQILMGSSLYSGFGMMSPFTNRWTPFPLGPQCIRPLGRAPIACFRGNRNQFLQSLGAIFAFAVPQGYLSPLDANDDPFVALYTPGYYP